MKQWKKSTKCLRRKIRLISLVLLFLLIKFSTSSMEISKGVGCVLSCPTPISTEYNFDNKGLYVGNYLFNFDKVEKFYIYSTTDIKEFSDRACLRLILSGGITNKDKLYSSVGLRLGDAYYIETNLSTEKLLGFIAGCKI